MLTFVFAMQQYKISNASNDLKKKIHYNVPCTKTSMVNSARNYYENKKNKNTSQNNS